MIFLYILDHLVMLPFFEKLKMRNRLHDGCTPEPYSQISSALSGSTRYTNKGNATNSGRTSPGWVRTVCLHGQFIGWATFGATADPAPLCHCRLTADRSASRAWLIRAISVFTFACMTTALLWRAKVPARLAPACNFQRRI